MTLVYAGEIPDLKPTVRNELAKEMVSIALEFQPMTIPVIDVEILVMKIWLMCLDLSLPQNSKLFVVDSSIGMQVSTRTTNLTQQSDPSVAVLIICPHA